MYWQEHRDIKKAIEKYDQCQETIEKCNAQRAKLEEAIRNRRVVSVQVHNGIGMENLEMPCRLEFHADVMQAILKEYDKVIAECVRIQKSLECPCGTRDETD